jgi:hypothetical protein
MTDAHNVTWSHQPLPITELITSTAPSLDIATTPQDSSSSSSILKNNLFHLLSNTSSNFPPKGAAQSSLNTVATATTGLSQLQTFPSIAPFFQPQCTPTDFLRLPTTSQGMNSNAPGVPTASSCQAAVRLPNQQAPVIDLTFAQPPINLPACYKNPLKPFACFVENCGKMFTSR